MPITVTLTDQPQDHPLITPSGRHESGGFVEMVNHCTRNLAIFTRDFSDKTNTSYVDLAEGFLPAGSQWTYAPDNYLMTTGPRPVPRNIWLGFAYIGSYATAAAYFAAHPQGGGHHTVEITE